MTLSQFYDFLENHDWYYQYSDDHSVYSKGSRERVFINKISSESENHRNLLKGFEEHIFSGPEFNTKKAIKPDRPR